MAQLIMNWTNDGLEAKTPVLPDGVEVKSFPELTDAVDIWLDIVRYMNPNDTTLLGKIYYDKTMLGLPNYKDELCYFILVEGVPAATITIICDSDKKSGYIHMVSSKPEFRGRGLGNVLSEVAIYTLKKEGMKTARLKTDDWRVPAIKTYIKAGFVPDIDSEPDYKERWEKLFFQINKV